MRKDVEWLQTVTSEYAKLEVAGGFQIVYFLESSHEEQKGSEYLNHEEEEQERQKRMVGMGKTHGMMIRFPNAEDEDFRKVERCLIKITK